MAYGVSATGKDHTVHRFGYTQDQTDTPPHAEPLFAGVKAVFIHPSGRRKQAQGGIYLQTYGLRKSKGGAGTYRTGDASHFKRCLECLP